VQLLTKRVFPVGDKYDISILHIFVSPNLSLYIRLQLPIKNGVKNPVFLGDSVVIDDSIVIGDSVVIDDSIVIGDSVVIDDSIVIGDSVVIMVFYDPNI
jgi:NDP-sugar pyrophosphorylase family protein